MRLPALLLALGLLSGEAWGALNLLFLLVDDLGNGDLSCQGAEDLRTPHIDALFAKGLHFDRGYANCPVCSPTRAAFLSGRYQELVGVPGVIRTHAKDSWGYLNPGVDLLPVPLKKAGYATALIGKWHLGLEPENHPNARGFDHFHGFLGDMMDDYYKHRRHGNNYMRKDAEVITPEGHATDVFTDWAVEYLRGRVGKEEPFFLYLAYNAPHTPIQPPADWLAKVVEREEGIDPRRAKLVALIEHLDAGVGRVMAALEETGLAGETLVVFTSDNGGQLDVGARNGALRGGKQDMYEGGLRVPTCAVWPGVIEAGRRSEQRTLTMDWFPTFLQAAGVEVPAGIDGVGFLSHLKGGEAVIAERDVFFTRREGNQRYMGESTWAMLRGNRKLVKNSPFEGWEFYDLQEDPLEEHDLAGKRGKDYMEMVAAMRRQIQRGGAVRWQKGE
ncbi:MAG: sulfatase-like hydrolase/transferase [Verrucomicrobia bacterium]|nr:sulfatase-like hydrolase/transferase [Verrucomicrobiota bacterium]